MLTDQAHICFLSIHCAVWQVGINISNEHSPPFCVKIETARTSETPNHIYRPQYEVSGTTFFRNIGTHLPDHILMMQTEYTSETLGGLSIYGTALTIETVATFLLIVGNYTYQT
jgi:hypothetical protein